ncbi:HAD family hydrolase [Sanguibacter sp. 25GB23B1]|uniref:HAD family hydrolase n=1 Tax=Sanguibacter sp. 25GB23B1 TaxID=3156067 RepID=UPI0032AF4626
MTFDLGSSVERAATPGPAVPSRPTVPDALQADRKLVALDVDGTLMTYDEFLSEEICDAVSDVRAAGHQVVLATGRPLVALMPVAHLLGIDDGWVVCSNGSVTARIAPGSPNGFVLDDVVMFDPHHALRVVRDHMPLAKVAVEEIGVGYWVNEVFPERMLHGLHTVMEFEELCGRETARVVAADAQAPSRDFQEALRLLGLIDTYFVIGGTRWMDVAPHGVTKASALERLRGLMGIAREHTVAIGDGGNDLDMLAWAGRGVAMGHAEAQVIAAADEVTGSILDDGAVPVLRSLLTG